MDLTPVSILLPVKNGIKFWPKAENSLINYVRPFDEIIVVDDNSNDGSLEYAKQLEKEINNFQVLKNPGSGLVDALNFGLKSCSNVWVARHDIDDSYASTRLHDQLSVRGASTVAIFSDYEFINSVGVPIGVIPTAVLPSPMGISIYSSQRTPHPSVLFHREAVIDVGGYRIQDFPAEDLSLWLRLSKQGELRSVPKTLLYYQMSATSVTATKRLEMQKKCVELKKCFPISPAILERYVAEVPSIFDLYEELSLAKERKILSIRDLLFLRKRGILSPKSFLQIIKLPLELDSYKAYANLKKGKRLRSENRARV